MPPQKFNKTTKKIKSKYSAHFLVRNVSLSLEKSSQGFFEISPFNQLMHSSSHPLLKDLVKFEKLDEICLIWGRI